MTKGNGNADASSSKPRPPRIMGGGRAKLSAESEESIVNLLRELRLADEGGGGGDGAPPKSQHRIEGENRRFVRGLVERHRRERAARLVMQRSTTAMAMATASTPAAAAARSESRGVDARSREAAGKRSSPPPSGGRGAGGKVRIELVEAVYPAAKKSSSASSSSKSGGNKKKSKEGKSSSWKPGSKKVMVLPRSTTAAELGSMARSKLKMKGGGGKGSPPLRCFCVVDKIEVELHADMNISGLKDGATVYVGLGREGGEGVNAIDGEGAVRADDDDDDESSSSPRRQPDEEDPLAAVRAAYCGRRRRRPGIGGDYSNTASSSPHPPASHGEEGKAAVRPPPPPFASCLDGMEREQPLSEERAALPAAAYRRTLLRALDESRILVICGATGCGKSTQVPQYILEGMIAAGRGDEASIMVTQPRRVAATSLADRVAEERDTPPPGKPRSVVGYNVRLAKAVTRTTKITYCTIGILLRMLIDQSSSATDAVPPLADLTHVVIDEVHERDVNTDFVLTLLRRAVSRNDRLRVVLMSATASHGLFVDYFASPDTAYDYNGGDDSRDSGAAAACAPPRVISIPGRTFPIQVRWLDECEAFAGGRIKGWEEEEDGGKASAGGRADPAGRGADGGLGFDGGAVQLLPRATSMIDNGFTVRLARKIVEESSGRGSSDDNSGAILIFMPGKGEIESLCRHMRDDAVLGDSRRCALLMLHSNVPHAQQRKVFLRPKAGVTKIVIATNVAETSITIPDVSHVIDTGREKESRYNPETRIRELVTVWTSRASATQRRGRAGRTGPGTAWCLYRRGFYEDRMLEHRAPEIMRTPLDELVLQACLLEENSLDVCNVEKAAQSGVPVGYSPLDLLSNAPEPPPVRRLQHACKHLIEVGALSIVSKNPRVTFRLTPLGYHLSHLPMDVKVGKILIVGCILGCVEASLTIASILSNPKSCWVPQMSGPNGRQRAREVQKAIVEDGFGGRAWKGGTVKGDLVASVAAYNAWSSGSNDRERRDFARENALDHQSLRDIRGLRAQFYDYLLDAGFVTNDGCENSQSDALMTSCCLVSGLHPNVAILMRPRRGRGNIRGGRLVTKDEEVCLPSSSSFQAERIRNASDEGKDAYVVYHSKHRTLGAQADTSSDRPTSSQTFLNDINFVSKFALLLFGGDIEVKDDALVVDGWLKFKVGEKGEINAVLINELRKELDKVMIDRISGLEGRDGDEYNKKRHKHCQKVIEVVTQLLLDP